VALTDLEKAHDSVPKEILWKEMENVDINPTLIESIINPYEKNTRRIKKGIKLTE
jgi:hypothetical protein